MKRHTVSKSEPSPVKVHPKPSLALVKSCESGDALMHIRNLAENAYTLLNKTGEDDEDDSALVTSMADKCLKSIMAAAVLAAQREAAKYVNLVEVDRSVGSFRS